MKYKLLTLLILLYPITVLSTPGDAAYRGGHYEQAAELYKKGAEQGDAKAALKLGLMLSNKINLPEEYQNALYWFTKSCGLGLSPACHNVGYAYEMAKNGVEEIDYKKAELYYRTAAENGYMQSQYNLASMYSNNYITPPNDVEGYMWLNIAFTKAGKCSNHKLCQWVLNDPPGHGEKLKGRMSHEQINEALSRAAKWEAK